MVIEHKIDTNTIYQSSIGLPDPMTSRLLTVITQGVIRRIQTGDGHITTMNFQVLIPP